MMSIFINRVLIFYCGYCDKIKIIWVPIFRQSKLISTTFSQQKREANLSMISRTTFEFPILHAVCKSSGTGLNSSSPQHGEQFPFHTLKLWSRISDSNVSSGKSICTTAMVYSQSQISILLQL